jgi:hypothetical protein
MLAARRRFATVLGKGSHVFDGGSSGAYLAWLLAAP